MDGEVLFEVGVTSANGLYGLTLWIDDGLGEEEDIVPCFRLMVRAPNGSDEESVARAFGQAHREAMDALGIGGEMSADELQDRLVASIETAGALMIRYGLSVIPRDEMDERDVLALWSDEMVEMASTGDKPS